MNTYNIPSNLLQHSSDAKTKKGISHGYITGILYLAPSDQSGVMNTCKYASKGCRSACLYSAGRGRMPSVIKGRVNKTKYFHANPRGFIDHLKIDITKLIKTAKRTGEKLCIRLNGTSDLRVHELKGGDGKTVFEFFPDVQFYDYTKDAKKCRDYAGGKLPKNYHLTFSRPESNKKHVKEMLSLGVNVAVVFLGALPKKWENVNVVNGDDTDLRFLDKKGVVVGLTAKGDAKTDKSGFCVNACQG